MAKKAKQLFEPASNGQDSFTTFRGRKQYRDRTFPQDGPVPLDMWYEKQYYGKVDNNQDAIFISETNLRQLPAKKTVFVADFVADAFKDLLDYIRKAMLHQKIQLENAPFLNLEPQRGWESINASHHDYISGIYNIFVPYILENSKSKKLYNFRQFMDMFVSFLRDLSGQVPVTRSGYIYSYFCTPMTSGLMIDFERLDHSSDDIKKIGFIDNPHFEFYRNAARRFGFMVDKNAPWRLVADVSSPRMQKYMRRYGVQEKQDEASVLFETYYYQAFVVDIDILRKYMLHMYNSFFSVYPNYNGVERSELSEEAYLSQYNDAYWIKTYFKIRLIESGKHWNDTTIRNRIKKALEINNSLDFSAAIVYINSKVRFSIDTKGVF